MTQEALASALQARLDDCARLAGGVGGKEDVQVLLVIATLNLNELARLVRKACASSAPERLRAWSGNYTKCVLLAGNWAKLRARFEHLPSLVGDGAVLVGPAPAHELLGLRRLLKPLRATRSLESTVAQEPPAPTAPGPAFELLLATRGLAPETCLIGLVHALAESSLLERLPSDARIELKLVDDIDVLDARDLYRRIHLAAPPALGLKLYGALRCGAPSC